MRTKTLNNAKFIIMVESNKRTHIIKTSSLFDNRTKEYLPEEYINERGIDSFLDVNDLKETLKI